MTRATLPVLLLVAALATMPMDGMADDYYIDPVNGSDTTGDGSQTEPWKTLTYANSQTKCQGTEENPVVLHALAGVYSPSTNGETFPVLFQQYTTSGVPHFGVLAGAGRDVTILDAEGTEKVLYTNGYGITVSDLTVTGGSHPELESGGGGMNASIGSITGSVGWFKLVRCVIRDNCKGKGLQTFGWFGTVDITDCAFTGNQGDPWDGKVAFSPYLGQLGTITNCLFANNTENCEDNDYGGAIYIEANNYFTITNCTIVDNDKTGIYAHGREGRVTIRNCIIWGNDDDLLLTGTLDYSISHCNISDGDGVGENGNISQDPLFVTGAHGDYYLSHSGVNTSPTRA